MCIAYTHDRTRISFQFLFIQNIYILFENVRGWDFVLHHLFILFSSICLNEAVAQLTDEQRWWRHRVRCCSNCRYVIACSQVCAWSTDLPSTCLQVIESVVRVLGIEKRPTFAIPLFTFPGKNLRRGTPAAPPYAWSNLRGRRRTKPSVDRECWKHPDERKSFPKIYILFFVWLNMTINHYNNVYRS